MKGQGAGTGGERGDLAAQLEQAGIRLKIIVSPAHVDGDTARDGVGARQVFHGRDRGGPAIQRERLRQGEVAGRTIELQRGAAAVVIANEDGRMRVREHLAAGDLHDAIVGGGTGGVHIERAFKGVARTVQQQHASAGLGQRSDYDARSGHGTGQRARDGERGTGSHVERAAADVDENAAIGVVEGHCGGGLHGAAIKSELIAEEIGGTRAEARQRIDGNDTGLTVANVHPAGEAGVRAGERGGVGHEEHRAAAGEIGRQVDGTAFGVHQAAVGGGIQIAGQRAGAGTGVQDHAAVQGEIGNGDGAARGPLPDQAATREFQRSARESDGTGVGGRVQQEVKRFIALAGGRHGAAAPLAGGVKRGRTAGIAIRERRKGGRYVIGAEQKIGEDLVARQGHAANADFGVIVICLGIGAPLRAAEPVVHILHAGKMIGHIQKGHGIAIAKPLPAATGAAGGTGTIRERDGVMMLYAQGGGQTGIKGGRKSAQLALEPLDIVIGAIRGAEGYVIGRLRCPGGSSAGSAGVFARRTEAITRLNSAAEIHDARPVRCGQWRGPDLDGNIGVRRQNGVRQIDVGGDGIGRDIAGGAAGNPQRIAGVSCASTAHDGGSARNEIVIGGAGRGGTGGVGEHPMQDHIIQVRPHDDAGPAVGHGLRAGK